MSNKMPGCHLANAWRSRSKHILQWRYRNEVSVSIQFNSYIWPVVSGIEVCAPPSVYKINCSNVDNFDLHFCQVWAIFPAIFPAIWAFNRRLKVPFLWPWSVITSVTRETWEPFWCRPQPCHAHRFSLPKVPTHFSFRNIRKKILNIIYWICLHTAQHSYTFTYAYHLHSLSTHSLQTWVNIELLVWSLLIYHFHVWSSSILETCLQSVVCRQCLKWRILRTGLNIVFVRGRTGNSTKFCRRRNRTLAKLHLTNRTGVPIHFEHCMQSVDRSPSWQWILEL